MAAFGLSIDARRSSNYAILVASLAGAVALARPPGLAGTPERDAPELGRSAPGTDAARLAVLDWSLWSVAKYYVDPSRVDAKRVILSALESLEREVPEILIEELDGEAGPNGSSSVTTRVRVRVATEAREWSLEVEGLWQVALRLREIFAFVLEHAELDDDQRLAAEFALVDGVLETLDPHTRLLRPEALEEMNQSTKGSFGGLGIEVGVRDDAITILRVLDGTPAQDVGLQAGDRIVQVDGESTVAQNLSDAVALLKGPPDTTVVVHVRREGVTETLRYEVRRAIITLESVTGDLLPVPGADGTTEWIGLVQIPRTFARTTGAELREQLERFDEAGVRGVVLDMRQNAGGLLDAAVEVADAFLDEGVIVSTVGSADLRKVETARAKGTFSELPVVVLIDEGSASATEIVAGALRNHDRALIMGRRSFGKGSVQVLYDRRVGDSELGLKLTRAQYLTPGEVSIQSVGVSPDLETIPVWIGEEYSAFFGRRRFDLVREETLSEHLDNETARAQTITAGPLYYLQPGSLGTNQKGADQVPPVDGLDEEGRRRISMLLRDPELRIARDLVAWAPSPDRKLLLEAIDEFVGRRAEVEEANIASSLALREVDWSRAPAGAPQADLQFEVSSDAAQDIVPAGDEATVTVAVTNVGETPAYRVRAISDSDYGYYDERELLFGRIEPGQRVERKMDVAAAAHELTRRDRVSFAYHADGGVRLAPGSRDDLDLGIRGRARPDFALGYQILDDPRAGQGLIGDGDGRLEPGERAALLVFVGNRGEGVAPDAVVRVRAPARSPLFFDTGRADVGAIEREALASARFTVELPEYAGSKDLELQISVADAELGDYLSQQIHLPMAPSAAASKTEVKGKTRSETVAYAGAGEATGRLAEIPAGTVLEADLESEGWLRVGLPSDLARRTGATYAFVRRDDLDLSADGGAVGAWTWNFAISPPQIDTAPLASSTPENRVKVQGVAHDESYLRDLYVTVYNPARHPFDGADKVYYLASDDPETGRLEFSAEVPLEPGNNLIEVYARGRGEVVGIKRQWVLSTDGLEEARAIEAERAARRLASAYGD